MEIFDDISKGIRDAASYTVGRAEEFGETARIKLALHSEAAKLEKAFAKLGALYYSFHKTGVDNADKIAAVLSEVDEIKLKQKMLKEKLAEVQKAVVCSACGVKTPGENKFCPNCGAKLEK